MRSHKHLPCQCMQNSEMILSSNQYVHITRGRLYAKSDMCSLQLAIAKGNKVQLVSPINFGQALQLGSFCMEGMQAIKRAQKLNLTWKTLGLMLHSTCGPDMMRSCFLRILMAASTGTTGASVPSGDHSLMACSMPLVARTGKVGWHCMHSWYVSD